MTQDNKAQILENKGRSSVISYGWLALIIISAVIIIDQIVKIYVKTHFYMGEDLEVLKWFHIKFIENNGMAFGLELWNKLFLTFGRILAVCLFIWFIFKIKDNKELRPGFMVSIALITAGAAGNIFDCVFYGQLFNDPFPPEIATMFPEQGGYAGWFEGRVVDMFYFPFFDFYWPDWIPVIGGNYYEFFAYIFNVADSSICIGVFLLILFYSKDATIAFKSVSGSKEERSKEEK